MRQDTVRAKALLEAEHLTCALCLGDARYTATARGVAPLLFLLDDGTPLQGFCAADKVVGAGAAYLYVLLGVQEVFACIVSEPASEILTRYGISLHYGTLVPHIRNRAGDGYCPIETAVADATDPTDALMRIRRRLAELRSK